MGYNIYITRANNWFENNGNEISPSDWLEFVRSDPDLELAGYNGPYFVLWYGKSKVENPWFDFKSGNIYTKNPDKLIIGKMLEIASKMNAIVQGDDGEIYRIKTKSDYFDKKPQNKIKRKKNNVNSNNKLDGVTFFHVKQPLWRKLLNYIFKK